jgi:hypothetical protein
MNLFVEQRILHVCYSCPTLPSDLDDLGTLYEGYLENRIGVNLPMRVLKAVEPQHKLCAYDADYIICYPDWDRHHTRNHELRHAAYFLDKTYRKKVDREWEELSSEERLKISKKLSTLGYSPEVHCDEWQAYQKVIP